MSIRERLCGLAGHRWMRDGGNSSGAVPWVTYRCLRCGASDRVFGHAVGDVAKFPDEKPEGVENPREKVTGAN